MTARTALALTLACLVLQMRGCVSRPAEAVDEVDTKTNDKYMKMQPMIARACNYVSLGVYKQIAPNFENVVLSPFSICSLLAVCMTAAKGKTHNELKGKLVLKLTNREEILEIYRSVYQSFREDKHVNITTSNLMLVNKHLRLVSEGEQDYRTSFNGTVRTFDPEMKEMTSSYINALVSSATNGLLMGDLEADDISSENALYLTNTLTLSAKWKDLFEVDNTYPMTFFLNSSSQVLTDTMYRRGYYRWNKSKSLKSDVIEIPYEGERFAMYIILPFEKEGLADLEKNLAHRKRLKLEDVFSNMEEAQETDLYLPKFSLSQSFSMKRALKANKIRTVFDKEHADLSALIQGGKVYIKEAFQRSTITVDEFGTVAGTYSRMMGQLFSAVPRFKATHPFLYVLRDRQSEFNIFMGKFSRPQAAP